ncbi:zinc-binding alcohol dehydrogenase family protein [Peribacillus sp. SCS-37]|uniref:quinone oxidoreductase family protein n=1 Tax=Paraperibacillus esterisolvens TaxID=3115296 RepID=UPI003906CA83
MKAVIQKEFGSADVLACEEIEIPVIRPNEVLIKLAYTSVNFADIKKRRGTKGAGSFPMVLGLDAAGTIERAPADSTFKPGDRVIAFPRSGSYAEYAAANESLVFKIPDDLTLLQAAAMPTVAILAHILLHEIGQVEKSHTIVVHSAGGGAGSMLVVLARIAGISKIIGTAGSLDKESYIKRLGAHSVYTYETFTQRVWRETDGKGADIIFDSVVGEVTAGSLDCLAHYGTLVQFGNSSGQIGTFRTSDVHSSCRNIKGSASAQPGSSILKNWHLQQRQ